MSLVRVSPCSCEGWWQSPEQIWQRPYSAAVTLDSLQTPAKPHSKCSFESRLPLQHSPSENGFIWQQKMVTSLWGFSLLSRTRGAMAEEGRWHRRCWGSSASPVSGGSPPPTATQHKPVNTEGEDTDGERSTLRLPVWMSFFSDCSRGQLGPASCSPCRSISWAPSQTSLPPRLLLRAPHA